MNVLITSFGSNTAIGVAKALKINSDIKIIGTDSNPVYQCAGYEFADSIIQAPLANEARYEIFLLDTIKKYKIDCVIPIHDKEVEIVAQISEQHIDLTNWAVNKISIVKLCNNKKQINNLLHSVISVPEVFKNIDEAKYPFIIKPNQGVSSKDLFIVSDVKNKPALSFNEEWIIQSFIEGKEYTVDCYSSYDEQAIFKYAVRERIETKNGMSTKGKIIDIPILGEYCKTIHSVLNYKGVSNIQFIEKNGQFYFIEINPRFAGGGILTYKSGFNFPLFTVLELTKNIDLAEIQNAEISIGNQMVRYLSETFFDSNDNFIRP